MRRTVSLLSLAVSAAAATVGCASTGYHYSQIFGTRYHRAPIDTYPVSVLRIDDKDNVFRPALVDPGLRQITLQGPPGGAGGFGKVKTFALRVAPCTRYYVVAVKSNKLDSDFAMQVDFQEPVAGCT
ncbi:MAG: hypothetical protein M3Z29_03075 [Pseudomonadota bacterium]|nr:hypothetical protein [Pseudomonadota bacterium]